MRSLLKGNLRLFREQKGISLLEILIAVGILAVIVPAYDSRTDADDVYIDANMALILEGISITSWQIY